MGYSKRLWEEEIARGYHTSDDTICADCFRDDGIRNFINGHLEASNCSVCGRKAQELIAAPADKLLEFFLHKVHEHYEIADGNAPFDSEEGRYFTETWDIHDLVYYELADIAELKTLKWLDNHLKDDFQYCQLDWQFMSSSEALKFAWERFCQAVKHETRFLFFSDAPGLLDEEPHLVRPAEMLSELGNVILGCGLVRAIPSGSTVFRARAHETGKPFSDPVDVGPPPQQHAKTAGRMNAPGIVVMYCSFDLNTALMETTRDCIELSAAEVELLEDVWVVDLTNIPRVPSIFESGPREYLRFLHQFSQDVSQPFNPDLEVHIEYAPTQVVSEYLRHRLHDSRGNRIRGVLYSSAKNIGGTNLALFVESQEVEGVALARQKLQKPLLRLLRVQEVT